MGLFIQGGSQMKGTMSNRYRIAFLLAAISLTLILSSSSGLAAKSFEGKWTFTVTIPVAPRSNQNQTLTLTIDAFPRQGLHGRMLITDAENRTLPGVWRKAGKKVSLTYELPCSGDEQCASLVLLGKAKSSFTRIKKGEVIVMWDSDDDRNPALFDTSNGSFSATRLE